jgi:hypothetical protein
LWSLFWHSPAPGRPANTKVSSTDVTPCWRMLHVRASAIAKN